jgi:hypothetical protein
MTLPNDGRSDTRKHDDMKIAHWDKESPCWIWPGWKNEDGYGTATRGGKQIFAHRLAYSTYVGIIPDGLCVLHRCDNPPCVNPSHLFLGTWADNNRDRAAKGRNGVRPTSSYRPYPDFCKHGHPYDENNKRYRRRKNGQGYGLYCRSCNLERVRRYYQKRRQSL